MHRKSVPKNRPPDEALAAYIRRFAEKELPIELREDGVSEAWCEILETAAGVDVRAVVRRAIWRLKKREQRRAARECPEVEGLPDSNCPE